MQTTELTRTDVVPPHLLDFDLVTYEGFLPNVVHVTGYEIPGYTRYYEEVSPDEEGPRSQWKNFQHYKLDSSSFVPSGYNYLTSTAYVSNSLGTLAQGVVEDPFFGYDATQYGKGGLYNKDLIPMYVEGSDGSFVPPPDDLIAIKDASLASMLPIIKSNLSIVNSILELRDFSSLPRTIKTLSSLPAFKILPEVRQRFRLAYRGWTKSLRQWNRAAADTYLQASFNVLPLLSDISGIYSALKRTERRINDFITRSGKTRHSHYRKLLAESPLTVRDEFPPAAVQPLYNGGLQLASSLQTQRFVYSDPTTFHAEIEYNYNYTRYQVEHARLLSLLDAVGANLNPAIIWNAIPWSFVVDWVFGVSQWLSKQRIGFMDPQINIHRYLWSVKRSRRIVVQRQITSFINGVTLETSKSPWIPLPSTNESAYRRSVGIPEASSIISSGLNVREFSLGAALVLARRRHPTRRKSWAFNYEFPG